MWEYLKSSPLDRLTLLSTTDMMPPRSSTKHMLSKVGSLVHLQIHTASSSRARHRTVINKDKEGQLFLPVCLLYLASSGRGSQRQAVAQCMHHMEARTQHTTPVRRVWRQQVLEEDIHRHKAAAMKVTTDSIVLVAGFCFTVCMYCMASRRQARYTRIAWGEQIEVMQRINAAESCLRPQMFDQSQVMPRSREH